MITHFHFWNFGRCSLVLHPSSFAVGVHYASGRPIDESWALMFDIGPLSVWIRFGTAAR